MLQKTYLSLPLSDLLQVADRSFEMPTCVCGLKQRKLFIGCLSIVYVPMRGLTSRAYFTQNVIDNTLLTSCVGGIPLGCFRYFLLPLQNPVFWKAAFKEEARDDLKLDGPGDGPLHTDLIKEVMKYADLTQITYDNFIGNPNTLTAYQAEGAAPPAQDPGCKEIGNFKYTMDRVMSVPFGTGTTEVDNDDKFIMYNIIKLSSCRCSTSAIDVMAASARTPSSNHASDACRIS